MQTDPRSSTSGGSELGALLADEEYLRVRVAPAMGHVNYLCFQDLLRVVTRFAQQVKGTVFDYGCGGAPYRELFRHCAGYVGADARDLVEARCRRRAGGAQQQARRNQRSLDRRDGALPQAVGFS